MKRFNDRKITLLLLGFAVALVLSVTSSKTDFTFGAVVDMGAYEYQTCAPVSLWPGDGDASDSFGGNHGTLMNGTTFALGKIGQAFSFDGVDDYVKIPYDDSINLSSFTLQAWVKFSQRGPDNPAIICRPSDGNPTDGYSSFVMVTTAWGGIGGGVQGEGSSYSTSVSTERSFADNNWHMCSFVRDVQANQISIYVDSVLHKSWPRSSPGDMEHNYKEIFIGSRDGSKGFFEGLIDEVAIYNCALSVDEIQNIFLAAGGQSNTPLGYDVVVQPVDSMTGTHLVTITFDEVTKEGVTVLTTTSSGPTPPSGFMSAGKYYDVTSTAIYSSPVKVCIQYEDTRMSYDQEYGLKMYHYDNGVWVDVTNLPVDTTNNIICGTVASLSLFGIFTDITPPDIADFNGDRIVDLKDFSKLAQYWGQSESSVDIGPMPWGDGLVDIQDLAVLVGYWLKVF